MPSVPAIGTYLGVLGVTDFPGWFSHGIVPIVMVSMPERGVAIPMFSGGMIRLILHIALSPVRLAPAFPILPHGLYTENAVVRTNTANPPTAWTTNWTHSPPKSYMCGMPASGFPSRSPA
jgi:hypothetical protein